MSDQHVTKPKIACISNASNQADEDFYKVPGENRWNVPSPATDLGLSSDPARRVVDLALKDKKGRIIRAVFQGPTLDLLFKCCMDALHIKQASMVVEQSMEGDEPEGAA